MKINQKLTSITRPHKANDPYNASSSCLLSEDFQRHQGRIIWCHFRWIDICWVFSPGDFSQLQNGHPSSRATLPTKPGWTIHSLSSLTICSLERLLYFREIWASFLFHIQRHMTLEMPEKLAVNAEEYSYIFKEKLDEILPRK